MGIGKKLASLFVEVEERKPVEAAPPAAESAPVLPEEVDQDPHVQRARQAIELLAGLPLNDIPAEKARELIVRTLKFAGLDAEELLESLTISRTKLAAQIRTEQETIAERQQESLDTLSKLEQAMAIEREDCAQEVAAGNGRIQAATNQLLEMEKAMAFFGKSEKPGR